MTPIQTLPSFEPALQPDHYKTLLPNISYPSRPSSHIPWSGSSAPLLFSVNFIFPSCFATALPFFVPPRKLRVRI
jgi:hypothetical protein